MEFINVDEIQKYHLPYEIDEHWNVRKDFLLAHAEEIPKDRLLCLAQTYSNVKLLRVEYSEEVMREVNMLAQRIGKKL